MSSRSLLIIDDEADIREVAGMALEALGGWSIGVAADGAEGLRCAQASPPDVILLDVMMPVLDGPSTLAALQGEPATASIPVIFMTAKAQPSELERLRSLGVAGVISKPFDPMNLHAEVEALLAATPSPQGNP